jgi:hypothetical protein
MARLKEFIEHVLATALATRTTSTLRLNEQLWVIPITNDQNNVDDERVDKSRNTIIVICYDDHLYITLGNGVDRDGSCRISYANPDLFVLVVKHTTRLMYGPKSAPIVDKIHKLAITHKNETARIN